MEEAIEIKIVTRDFLRYEVGDGSHTFLWHDKWHSDGALYQKCGLLCCQQV